MRRSRAPPLVLGTYGRKAAAMEDNPDLDTLAVLHCAQADLGERIRLQPRDGRTITGIGQADRRPAGQVSAKAVNRAGTPI
jgi:hypothetical protein